MAHVITVFLFEQPDSALLGGSLKQFDQGEPCSHGIARRLEKSSVFE